MACGDGAWQAALSTGALLPGGALELVDVFIPRMGTLMNTSAVSTQRVRDAGKVVGWYTSGNFPDGPYALNLVVEYSAMRPRLMMGTAAWKMDVDVFLYYALNGWAAYVPNLSTRRALVVARGVGHTHTREQVG